MRRLPLVFGQHALGDESSARFSLAPSEVANQESSQESFPACGAALESLRCDVLMELANRLMQASIEHPHLAPFLMDGLDCALENLGCWNQESQFQPIQQWLKWESALEKEKILGRLGNEGSSVA